MSSLQFNNKVHVLKFASKLRHNLICKTKLHLIFAKIGRKLCHENVRLPNLQTFPVLQDGKILPRERRLHPELGLELDIRHFKTFYSIIIF